jgi:polyphenol oxidase
MMKTAPNLGFIRHGFFTRREGVSEGIYQGLNCGSGSSDNKLHVAENREKVRNKLRAEKLVTLYQVHGRDVLVLKNESDIPDSPYKADALVSVVPNVAIGILTADCAPIIFACKNTHIIGAAHAGWKGAKAGVAEACICEMQKLGASNISAAIGACIKQKSYEVDKAFYDSFSDDEKQFFAAGREEKFQFDLAGYVKFRLNNAGIEDIWVSPDDTYSGEEYFSFRRTTHKKEPDYGRQVSVAVFGDS